MEKEPTLAEKACFVIDCLMSEGTIASDLEWRIGYHKDYRITNAELDQVNRLFSLIYELCHVGSNPTCIKSHDDWVLKLNELYNYFKDM